MLMRKYQNGRNDTDWQQDNIVDNCDLFGHSWNLEPDPDGLFRCIRCGEEQF